MRISYNKLWKLLIDKEMNKHDLKYEDILMLNPRLRNEGHLGELIYFYKKSKILINKSEILSNSALLIQESHFERAPKSPNKFIEKSIIVGNKKRQIHIIILFTTIPTFLFISSTLFEITAFTKSKEIIKIKPIGIIKKTISIKFFIK